MTNKNNKLNIVVGIILILVTIINTPSLIKRFDIYKNGFFIKALITNKETGGAKNKSYWIDFEYNGKEFTRQIGIATFNEYNIGERIELKTNKKQEYFLLKTENPIVRLIFTLIPGIIGLILILFFIIKYRKL
jgi:hypothetical protein